MKVAQAEGSIPVTREEPYNWPIYYAKDLLVGSLDSNVGICTLWTDKQHVATALDRSCYAVCGNLYSSWGVNFLFRNILANPTIRYLLLCGEDRVGSGDALVVFFRKGFTEDGRIVGTRTTIDREIPFDALHRVRRHVKLIDLRGKDLAKVSRYVRNLKRVPPFGEPAIFPDATPVLPPVLPSSKTGFKIEDRTVAEAWLKLLRLVMNFGEVKPSEYTADQKELLNVIAVVTDEDPKDIFFPEWLPSTRGELENYFPRVLSAEPRKDVGESFQLAFWGNSNASRRTEGIPGVSYTYGGRLRDYRGVGHDQIRTIIDRLRARSYTRRAVAVTWDPLIDGESDHPPCLIQLLTAIQEDKLFLTASFRSHDVYGAWPENAFALRRLQNEIAHNVGVALGPMTIISHSAHIYSDRWRVVDELLAHYYPTSLVWRDDPVGNFLVSLEGHRILVEHATTLGGKTGLRWEATNAREAYSLIINSGMVLYAEHAAYLGAELQKAELAIQAGLEYTQDKKVALRRRKVR